MTIKKGRYLLRSASRGASWWAHLYLRAATALALFATVLCGSISSAAANDVTVRVMTRNMYHGADLALVAGATTPAEFIAAVTQLYQNILTTKPAERAAAVAREIARNRPDLVGLQEASIVRTGAAPATNVVSDLLPLLLGELLRLGHHYEAIAIIPAFDAEAPTLLGFDVRLTDRTVILARAGFLGLGLRLSNMQAQHYLVNTVFSTPVGVPLLGRAGWASVDVTILGRTFRFATTHLTPGPPFTIQLAQAKEAVQSAANTTLPVVFVGDFNTVGDAPAHPSFPTYQLLVNAGFADAWKQKHPSLPGFTCCQAANLLNPTSALSSRIDLVLTRGAVSVRDIKIVGDKASDRTPSGLWPSDHAGLVATLRIGGQGWQGAQR
jgi:endonuclease/exonuclease/phosphatase family metal-dependent hydrolase